MEGSRAEIERRFRRGRRVVGGSPPFLPMSHQTYTEKHRATFGAAPDRWRRPADLVHEGTQLTCGHFEGIHRRWVVPWLPNVILVINRQGFLTRLCLDGEQPR